MLSDRADSLKDEVSAVHSKTKVLKEFADKHFDNSRIKITVIKQISYNCQQVTKNFFVVVNTLKKKQVKSN